MVCTTLDGVFVTCRGFCTLCLIMQGFFQGERGGGEHSPPGCPPPPLRGPPVTYSYLITFDIVHVESFPLLMAKAVLNECFALLNFRAPRRRKQSLSLSVLFFLLFVFQYNYMYRHLAYIVYSRLSL